MVRRIPLMLCTAVAACIAVLPVLSVKNAAAEQSLKTAAGQDAQQVIEKLLNALDVPVRFENLGGAPLIIRGAYVKLIKRAEADQLVGLPLNQEDDPFEEYATLPTVTLINNTDQRVTALGLVFINEQSNRWSSVYPSRISLEPHSEYTFKASEGIQPNKPLPVTTTKLVKWLPGRVSDLVVTVGMVEFADGNKWSLRNIKPLTSPSFEASGLELPEIPRVSGGVLHGSAVRRVFPVYPEQARWSSIDGQVAVEVIVDEEGKVISAFAISGEPLLREAAVQAARQWTFKQPISSGTPVKMKGTLVFGFKL